MCDACRGLALGELTFLTDRQWDAVKKVMCSDDPEEHDDCPGTQATEQWADDMYDLVKKQHEKIGSKLEALRTTIGGLTLQPAELALLVEAIDLVEKLPDELADAE